MTPVHFPLVHNRLPIINTDSYLDKPSVEYKRLKGLRKIESGDIVVFNFPAGDTVASKFEDTPEYYDLLVKNYGRERVKNDKNTFGEIIYRPVDRRQNFVKRAVGLPGETLKIVNDTIYIDGKPVAFPENVQFNYIAAMNGPLTDDIIKRLEITASDVETMSLNEFDRANLATWIPGAKDATHFYASAAHCQDDNRADRRRHAQRLYQDQHTPYLPAHRAAISSPTDSPTLGRSATTAATTASSFPPKA